MGFFWKNFKGICDPKARAESLIETIVLCFKVYMHDHPERDPNAWLAAAFQSRPGMGSPEEVNNYVSTAFFSVLPIEQAPIALGLYILCKEEPAMAARYGDAFNRIMAPVFALQQAARFVLRCREVHPWTASQ